MINNFTISGLAPYMGKIVDELLDEILSKIYYITNTSQCTTFLKSIFEDVWEHCEKELTEINK